ncbi:response regulator [Flavobacterium sp.]|uniref:response regulator n=1 Tax=Flavobacterium sp. TaxID=239 RepID=UPI00260C2912|nr:response regulator [Flavobacterium sp.]MDD3004093.1 response regulator [Flavobacterium sp.]
MVTKFRKNLLINSGISVLILIISSTASFLSINSLLESNNKVNHTQEIIYNLNNMQQIILEAQSGVRGFLINGNDSFLDYYSSSNVQIENIVKKLEKLTSDNSVQQAHLRAIRLEHKRFYTYLNQKVFIKRQGIQIGIDDINQGKVIMDSLRRLYSKMENVELELLKQRIESSKNYGIYSSILIIFAALIAITLSVIFFFKILEDFKKRVELSQLLEENRLETSKRIAMVSEVAEKISNGDYSIKVEEYEGSLGAIGSSLNVMSTHLKENFEQIANREWIKTGIAALNEEMIGEKTLEELTKSIIAYVAEYTESNAGVLYLAQNDILGISAGYCCVLDKTREYIAFGEGLAGQAARSKRMMELKTFDSNDILISYALGDIKPKHIIALPIIDGRVIGVIELASVKNFSDIAIEFLKSITNNVAIAIKAAENRKIVQELLEETQAQSEELKVQHVELEGMNAELKAQAEKLQASEEELRVQQEELQQTNEELAERSTLLEEKNLEIEKKSEDLELTNKYKSEFLANMSHELRTPLNSILLLSRLLSENNDKNMNQEQIEFAKVIQSSGNGLLGLIDEILDLSKIEAGKMELENSDILIDEVCTNMFNLFNQLAKEKNIEFKIIKNQAPLLVKTDQQRLEQILKNLISNAIKFTDKGYVTLEIVKHPTRKNRVEFIVKDTGIGIPLNKQPLIFEAFQQADGSTKRKFGGTGLGLSISRELSKLLGGEINLISELNTGSTFILTIPIAPESFPATINIINSLETLDEREQKLRSKKIEDRNKYISNVVPESIPDDSESITDDDKVILIIEDDINFAKSLLDFTRERGYKGIVTVRGDYALNLALKYRPQGILLDIQLPIKSGWEVMEELKANSLTKHIPVHIMSSHKLKQESLLKGAVNFLDKPVAFEKLPEIFKKIEHYINRESQKVLIIEENTKHAKALSLFLESNNITSEIMNKIEEGISALKQPETDCVILDMGIPDQHAYDILENIKKDKNLANLPVIVFTGKSLSLIEETKIRKYADSIVVKTAYSYQRMLDEVSLFLHIMEDNNPNVLKKTNKLNNILEGKTVLVVDDDVRNIYSLTKALESVKMKVLTAIDGNEAIKTMEQNTNIDVVLLDMMMPNKDGYEAATQIRNNKKWKNTPVIAVTAKAMAGDREKCINAGASDYITKPVDVDQLLSLLRVWLYDKF